MRTSETASGADARGRSSRCIWALLLGGTLSAGGCGETLSKKTSFDSVELEYALRGGASTCEEAPELVLSVADDLRELFSRDARKITYDLFADKEALAEFAPCGDNADGCFDPEEDRISTTEKVSVHELCHAVLDAKQRPPKVLEEGIATLVERDISREDGRTLGELYGPVDLTLLLSSHGWEHLRETVGPIYAYDEAAAVTRYFWDELGPEGFIEVYDLLDETDGAEERKQKLEQAFGRSLAEIEEGFLGFGRYPTGTRIWYPSALSGELVAGRSNVPRKGCGLVQSFRFSHAADTRTVLTVTGAPETPVSIENEQGIVHDSASLYLGDEGRLTAFIDGPSEELFLVLLDGSWVTEMSLEYRDLSALAEESPAVILALEPESHEPLCLSGGPWTITEGPRTTLGGEFVTARPNTIECCSDADCTTHDAWEGQLPRAIECAAGSCVHPSHAFPVVFGPLSLPPAPTSGRFFVLPLHASTE